MASKKKITQTAYTLLKGVAVMAFLFLYALGSSNIDSLHKLFHEHEAAELHLAQNEVDPCHITLYHQNVAGGCEHDTHLLEEDKCSLCDAQIHNVQFTENCTVTLPLAFCTSAASRSHTHFIEAVYFQSPGRAPPIS